MFVCAFYRYQSSKRHVDSLELELRSKAQSLQQAQREAEALRGERDAQRAALEAERAAAAELRARADLLANQLQVGASVFPSSPIL